MTVIGGFMPIPLAMMIPFMATQSMVMGDAFGRAFQYGKRKISAMSNEEFNATTLEQQASEMYASYRNIIPSLNQSIKDSQALQNMIIREMLLILPRFATSQDFLKPEPFHIDGQSNIQDLLKKWFGDIIPEASAHTDTSHDTTTDNPPFEIDEPQKYNQSIFRAMPLNELIKGINSGRFTGSDLSLAKHVLNTRQQPTDETLIPTPITSEGTVFQQWIDRKFAWEKLFLDNKKIYLRYKDSSVERAKGINAKREMDRAKTALLAMSRDYRNPNAAIGRAVLKLRQEIANGLLK